MFDYKTNKKLSDAVDSGDLHLVDVLFRDGSRQTFQVVVLRSDDGEYFFRLPKGGAS